MACSDPNAAMAGTAKLQSSDGRLFEVDQAMIVRISSLIRNMISDTEKDNDPSPLPVVDGDTLDLVLQWCRYHKDDPLEPEDGDIEIDIEDICSWDKQLVDVPLPVLSKLVKAADYLDIRGLVMLCCKKLANMIKGKSVEDIRKTMNITNDFCPEEEQEVIKKLEWCQGIISESASSGPSRS